MPVKPQTGAEAASTALLDQLSSPDATVREAAASALGGLGSDRSSLCSPLRDPAASSILRDRSATPG